MFYKFRPCSQRTWEILLNHELYFSTPSNLNDPLDSSIDIKSEYERTKLFIESNDPYPDKRRSFLMMLLDSITKTSPITGKEVGLNQAIYEYILTRGILSLSKNPHDALLWSHYADGHRGLCLGFNETLLDIEHSGHGDVVYYSKPPYTDKFIELVDEFETFCRPWEGANYPDERGKEFYNKQVDTMLECGLFSKSEKWRYEEEFRLVAPPGNHTFLPAALSEVIIGTKTSSADEKTIRRLLSIPEYSHVVLKKASHVPGTFDFETKPILTYANMQRRT